MVDRDTSFFHHLLELAVADWVRHIPAHAPEDDLPLKMTAFEIDHRGAPRSRPTTIMPPQPRRHSFATEPGVVQPEIVVDQIAGNRAEHASDEHRGPIGAIPRIATIATQYPASVRRAARR